MKVYVLFALAVTQLLIVIPRNVYITKLFDCSVANSNMFAVNNGKYSHQQGKCYVVLVFFLVVIVVANGINTKWAFDM